MSVSVTCQSAVNAVTQKLTLVWSGETLESEDNVPRSPVPISAKAVVSQSIDTGSREISYTDSEIYAGNLKRTNNRSLSKRISKDFHSGS